MERIPVNNYPLDTISERASMAEAVRDINSNMEVIWRAIIDIRNRINTMSARITNG